MMGEKREVVGDGCRAWSVAAAVAAAVAGGTCKTHTFLSLSLSLDRPFLSFQIVTSPKQCFRVLGF